MIIQGNTSNTVINIHHDFLVKTPNELTAAEQYSEIYSAKEGTPSGNPDSSKPPFSSVLSVAILTI